MNNLKDNLKEHFEAQKLNQAQFDKLNYLMSSPKEKPIWVRLSQILIPTAAIILISFMTVSNLAPLDEKIAKEVAKNHLKGMPSEIKTTDLSLIAKKLDKLDFKLISSVHTKDLILIGGRYCSIQGVTAAQLQYKDLKGNIYTVYQVPVQKDFKDIKGKISTLNQKGVQIDLFAEEGLLISIAK